MAHNSYLPYISVCLFDNCHIVLVEFMFYSKTTFNLNVEYLVSGYEMCLIHTELKWKSINYYYITNWSHTP